MGDIADAMLDGTLCETCGVYLGEGLGFPRKCEVCRALDDVEEELDLEAEE